MASLDWLDIPEHEKLRVMNIPEIHSMILKLSKSHTCFCRGCKRKRNQNGVNKEASEGFLKERLSQRVPEKVVSTTFNQARYAETLVDMLAGPFDIRRGTFTRDVTVSAAMYFIFIQNMEGSVGRTTSSDSLMHRKLYRAANIARIESISILKKHFNSKNPFWKAYSRELTGILSEYSKLRQISSQVNLKYYQGYAKRKFCFLNHIIDVLFAKCPNHKQCNKALKKSVGYLAIAESIRFDLDNFNTDVLKNRCNLGFILLEAWLLKRYKEIKDYSIDQLEKYLFMSSIAEKMLVHAEYNLDHAIREISACSEHFDQYLEHLAGLRVKYSLARLTIESYKITKFISVIHTNVIANNTDIGTAIRLGESYISKVQHRNGSWSDIWAKQGVSNVWTTAFVAMHMPTSSTEYKKAIRFLLKNRQGKLWGFNQNWVQDSDSTTCVLLALSKSEVDISNDLVEWLKSQKRNGGFSTFSRQTTTKLLRLLGFQDIEQIDGWYKDQVCVSALAYYLLSKIDFGKTDKSVVDKLRRYILKRRDGNGIWNSYWWTSSIYATCYAIRGLLNEKDTTYQPIIDVAVQRLISQQHEDGSFSCQVLKEKSVYYTSLVLATVCADQSIYIKYRINAGKMRDFLLKNQFIEGSFRGSRFLLVPKRYQTIKGDLTNLFSTSVAVYALRNLRDMTLIVSEH